MDSNTKEKGKSYEKTGWKTNQKSGADAEDHAIYYDDPYRFDEYV